MATPNPAVRDLVGRKLGRYEVLAQLASGGMATVYVARAQGVAGFERLVAIKVLHPHLAHDDEFISMFLDEARLAARIRHPNVVPTLDISDSAGDGYFLVMEYIEGDHFGGLLREAAKAGKRLPPGVSLRIVIDALEGLNAAHTLKDGDGHALGIVHRDISPHNILLGSDGVARITDFGVAKAEVRLSSTRDGQFKGKLSYMAPEQASSGLADQRSDLFSMGIVLWESLTARRLFRADNNGELLNRVLNGVIPKPSEIDPSLEPIDLVMAKALERDADKRYQTAAEFIDALEEAGAGLIATGQSGIANPRHVAKSVREWLGAKIDAEHLRIKASIDSLGKSELTSPGNKVPRPVEASGLTPSEIRPASRVSPEDATMGAKPSSVRTGEHDEVPAVAATDTPSRAPVFAVIGLLAVVAIGAGSAWAAGLFSGGEADVSDATAVPTPAAATPTAAPVVEEEETSETVPPEATGTSGTETEDVAEAEDEADDELDEVRGSVESAAAAAARRRRRERERAAAAASSGTETSGSTTAPSGGSTGTERRGREDDDLILSNPYRN